MEYSWNISWDIMEYWWNMYGLLWTILDMCKQKWHRRIDAIWSLGDFGQTKKHQIKGTPKRPPKNYSWIIHFIFTEKRKGVSINGNYPKMDIFSWYKWKIPSIDGWQHLGYPYDLGHLHDSHRMDGWTTNRWDACELQCAPVCSSGPGEAVFLWTVCLENQDEMIGKS